MNAERMAELPVASRVAVYAALADPTRLRVIDELTAGDASSSELADRLGIASNLLAHHLKPLQAAGLVERRRSEGDGRRSYWRVVPHPLLVGGTPALARPERVVFVCSANSARSQLAAALWRVSSAVPAASAGTHPAARIARGAVAAARRHRLDLPEVAPRHVDDVLHAGDLVVTVCDQAHEELDADLTGASAGASAGALHWSIPDPVPDGSARAFDRAHDDLAHRVGLLAPLVAPTSPRKATR